MPTYADLLQSITLDLQRPDLTDAVEDFTQRVIGTLQRVFWYDSPRTELVTLTAGDPFATVPDSLVGIDIARLDYFSVWQLLRPVEYRQILLWDVNIPSTRSVPTDYAPWAEKIRFFPVPDNTYTVELTGPGKIDAPVNPDDSNFWTNDCYTLIRRMVTSEIRLIRLRDPEGSAQDRIAAEQEKASLLNQTAARESQGFVSAHW